RAGHVEYRHDALGAVEVRFFEKLEERSLAHDVQNHHVDLDRAALHRTEGDRLLRDDRTERPDVRFVERAGHEPMDEARLADAFLAHEADLELEGLRIRVHRGPSQHGRPRYPAGGLSSRRPDFQIRERTGSNPSMSAIVPVRPSRGLSRTRTDNPARACFGATRRRWKRPPRIPSKVTNAQTCGCDSLAPVRPPWTTVTAATSPHSGTAPTRLS